MKILADLRTWQTDSSLWHQYFCAPWTHWNDIRCFPGKEWIRGRWQFSGISYHYCLAKDSILIFT